MRTFIKYGGLVSAVVGLPLVAGAQQTLGGVFSLAGALLNTATLFLVGIAVIVFFWGIIRYITGGPEMKASGMRMMIYGVIALFVMVTLWGLVRLLDATFLGGSGLSGAPSNIQSLIPHS